MFLCCPGTSWLSQGCYCDTNQVKKPFDYWNIQIFIFCKVIWFSVSGFRYSFVYIATCHHKLQMWSLSLQSLLLLTIIFSLSGCFIHTVLTELREKLTTPLSLIGLKKVNCSQGLLIKCIWLIKSKCDHIYKSKSAGNLLVWSICTMP